MQRLIEASQIEERVAELGRQIGEEYRGRPLTVIGVLTGGMVLLSDLIRRIELPLRVGLIYASSYRGRATIAGSLSIDASTLPDVGGRHVLLVDDIFDTGRTLSAIVAELDGLPIDRRPASVRVAALLWKEVRREVEWTPHYVGFKIPDLFVVGYGLDYNDEHRHLPYIASLDADDR